MKERICSKEFFKITVVYIIANDIIRGIYAHDLKNDTWIPNAIGGVLSVLLFCIYMFFYKNNKFDTFDNSMKHVLGKGISNIIYSCYAIYFIVVVFFNLVDQFEVIALHMLPKHNEYLICLILLIPVFYMLLKRIEVIARLSELLFYGIIFIFLSMIILGLTLHDYKIDNILPFLKDGVKPIIAPSLEMGYAVPYGELFVILIVFQHLENNENYTKVGIYAIMTAVFILTTITLFNVFIVGPYYMSYGISPAFRLARMIDIEEYVQRLDLLLIGFHMLLVFVKMYVLIYGAGYMLQNIFRYKEKQVNISYGVMLALLFLSFIIFADNYTSILLFRRKIFIKYISLIMEVFLPIIIVLISFLRKTKKIYTPQEIIEYDI